MIIGTVNVGRAKAETGDRSGKKQNRFKGGAGHIKVWDATVEDRLLRYSLARLDASTAAALRTYLTVTVDYAATPFTIIDDWGTALTVRWWDEELDLREGMGRLFSGTVTFRVET